MEALSVLIVVVFLLFLVLRKEIASCFDKSNKKDVSKLDPYADILDINIERVIYTKNNAKFKTTVLFSDGYQFETHITNREDRIFTYTISVDQALREQILRNAIFSHNAAVLENTGIRVPGDYIPLFRPNNSPAVPKSAVFSTDVWYCRSCGNQNLNRINTCQHCGVSKQWSDSQM